MKRNSMLRFFPVIVICIAFALLSAALIGQLFTVPTPKTNRPSPSFRRIPFKGLPKRTGRRNACFCITARRRTPRWQRRTPAPCSDSSM